MKDILILIAAVLGINVISAFLFFKDKGLNELKEDGIRKGKQKFMIVYTVSFVVVNIGIAIWLSCFYKDNTLLFNLKRLALLGMMWPLGYIDFKTFRIPNKFIVYGLILRFLILIFEILFADSYIWGDVLSEIITAAVLGLAIFICSLCVKNSIGYGDIKLFIVMGLFQGVQGIWSSVFTSLIIIFVFAIIMLIAKKKDKKDLLPFAPAIVAGTFVSVILTGM